MNVTPEIRERLEQLAREASRRAYAPYSKFPVGAAVLMASGQVFTGCNVENASYGLCNCAERTALFSAVAAGERQLVAVAVYTPTAQPTMPCGACRQVLNEFGPGAAVYCSGDGGPTVETSVDRLLPAAFGPASLA